MDEKDAREILADVGAGYWNSRQAAAAKTVLAELDAARATIAEQAAEDALAAMDPDDWANDGTVARAVVTALGRADLLAEPGELTALRATITRLRTAGQYLADVLRAGGTGNHTASGLAALARWEAALDAAPAAESGSGRYDRPIGHHEGGVMETGF